MTDARPWTHAALFGALWGALEATVGTTLYLARVPFRGSLIGIAGLLCLICLWRLQPRFGVCSLAGVVAIFLKVFTLGGLYPGPVVGIAVQAVAVDLAMSVFGNRRVGAAAAGFLVLATNPLQKLTTTWLVAGSNAVRASMELLEHSATAVGLDGVRALPLFLGTVGATGLVGAAAGLWSWRVAGRVRQRLAGQP
jgi:hypothetical protein